MERQPVFHGSSYVQLALLLLANQEQGHPSSQRIRSLLRESCLTELAGGPNPIFQAQEWLTKRRTSTIMRLIAAQQLV